jgi:Reverse transcriptase (RNA-dependent DNA polymerase)
LRMMEYGVELEFVNNEPPPPRAPYDSFSRLSGDPPRSAAMDATVREYHSKGILNVVPAAEQGRGSYLTLFLVPKKTPDAWRGCLDMRPVNDHVVKEHFKMEGLHTVRQLLRRDDWLTTVDITDAYPHLAVAPSHRRFMRFVWRGVHFEYAAMCFGLTSAPRLWTKLMRPVVTYLRAQGVRLVVYLDDLCILARSREESVRHTQMVVDLFAQLGLLLSPKSALEPSRAREFLGMTVDSHRMMLRVPPAKVQAVHKAVRATLRGAATGSLTVRQLAGLLGKLNAVGAAVAPQRLRCRELLALKNEAFGRQARWDAKVTLNSLAHGELNWWLECLGDWNGRTVLPQRPRYRVTTDASHHGWGAWTGRRNARGFWSRAEAGMSNNGRELKAAVLGVLSYREKLRGQVVEIRTDNTTTVAYVNHQGGRSRFLTELVRPLWEWALATGTHVFATHIPGKLNKRADSLSRWTRDRSDWKLDPRVFRRLERLWGPHTLDLFATRLNTQLPRFVSWRDDPVAVGTDAFRQDLGRERAYAHPPFNQIAKLLAMVRRQRATVTLVAPIWPSQPWWPELAALLVDVPVALPRRADLFAPGHLGSEVPMGGARWAAGAFRISGAPSSVAAFRQRLRTFCAGPGTTLRRAATRGRGAAGAVTVPGVGSIPLLPLPR